MVCSGWPENDSLYLRLRHSSKCRVASRCNGLGLDIKRPDQEDDLQQREKTNASCMGVNNSKIIS